MHHLRAFVRDAVCSQLSPHAVVRISLVDYHQFMARLYLNRQKFMIHKYTLDRGDAWGQFGYSKIEIITGL